MKTLKITLFFILCFAIQLSWAQKSLTLKPESKYEITTEVETSTTMSTMGQEVKMKQEEISTAVLEIISEEGDLYNFNMEVISISAKISQMGVEETYDSEDEESQSGPLGIAYNDRLNDKRKMEISKQGELVNPEEVEEEIAGENFSEFQQYFSLFIALPTDIFIGKTWTENQSLKTDEMMLESNSTYTVKSIDGDLITLEVKGDTSLRQDLVNEGARVKSNLRGTSSGEVVIGKSNNIIKSDNSFIQFEGNTQASGMNIPMSMKTSTKTNVKEIK